MMQIDAICHEKAREDKRCTNGIGMGREIRWIVDESIYILPMVYMFSKACFCNTPCWNLYVIIHLGQSHLLTAKRKKVTLTCEAARFHALAAPIQQG